MNWEVAGTIADILAAATVVISVLYLAKQVRDAADTNIAETNFNITESLNLHYSLLAQNAELARIYLVGNENPKRLDAEEMVRYSVFIGGVLARYDNVYRQYLKGNVSEDWWQKGLNHIGDLMKYPGVSLYWSNTKQQYHDDLQKLVDEYGEGSRKAQSSLANPNT